MNKGQRGRGFNSFRKHIEKQGGAKFIRSCSSCKFQDEEEGCTNNNVTSFDLVVDGDRKYCAYWMGYQAEETRKSKKRRDDW